ncbi:serine/threonine-protein kinase, partial [Catenulispora subtropica]|uniref:serine/threonine-protein kinase n=1 Tax=Catenulispora subtropica TaxID=450798 RepID=UPI0031D295DC
MEPLREDDPRSLGGFRVLALLAVGGMGRVYLALGADRRAVALKVARAEFAADARFRARFRREVETGRGIGKPCGDAWIAPVVAADPEAELPWLASEYVPGPSVTEALMGFGPLSAGGLRTLARGLALALAEVHAAGVVHRDVKPSNVLLARDGPRLIDFGVARAIDDVQLTRVGAVIGSPGFLSPEQAVGRPASFGSDVFSMASVVAYAACGVGPFGAGAGPALLYRVVHEPPKLVNVPRDLAEVLAACLVKDPGERPSAAEVAARVTAGGDWLPEPVLADIARRETELAAWIEVAGGPDREWEHAAAAGRAEADFEAAADTALELANAGGGVEAAGLGVRAGAVGIVDGNAGTGAGAGAEYAEIAFTEAAFTEAAFTDAPFTEAAFTVTGIELELAAPPVPAVSGDAPTPAFPARARPGPPPTARRGRAAVASAPVP